MKLKVKLMVKLTEKVLVIFKRCIWFPVCVHMFCAQKCTVRRRNQFCIHLYLYSNNYDFSAREPTQNLGKRPMSLV